MAFEVFEKGSAPIPAVPTLTIQKGGTFSLNRAAYRLVGEPEAFELLWDKGEGLVGLRPTSNSNPNGYPARGQNSKAPDKGPLMIAASTFSQYIGLDTTAGHRWNVEVIDGMAIVDLKVPGTKVVSNRERGRLRAEEQE